MVDKVNTSVTDAEVAVLSIVMNSPELVYNLEGLRYFMFSSAPHQYLFQEIEGFIESQTPVDVGLLIAKLESGNVIDKVGGKRHIESIAKQQYNPETLSEYRNIVLNSYKTRSIVSIATGIKAQDINVENVDEVINSVKTSLDRLSEARGGTQTVKIGDASSSIYKEIVSRLDHPGIKGISWGVDELDKATGGKCPGELIIIGGRPGQGKTALICNSILADAKQGKASLLFEREMRTQEVAERFLAIMTGIPITNIRLGVLNQAQVNQIYAALEELKNLPIYIDTSYRSSDLYYIESTVSKYKRLYDIQVVYLDYIQILIDRDENQTHELGRVSRLFKSLANELNICAVVLSQLSRAVELRDNKRPILSDLRQSGNLEEDADIVVGLYRDEYYNKETRYKGLMENIVLKYRNGPIGTVVVKFHDDTNVISS